MQNQRVPADVVLLRTSEKSGACFIRTDQLDGETDWKLKLSVETTQRLETDLVSDHCTGYYLVMGVTLRVWIFSTY